MIKTLLVGVSEYTNGSQNIPLCYNDIFAMKEALVLGLCADDSDICLLGENRIVNIKEFTDSLEKLTANIDEKDTLIIYFSGHGCKHNNTNFLVFSNGLISIEDLISKIDMICCKNKIIVLDSCNSGNKDIVLTSSIDINETADQFVGHGCAILASCDLDEYSGFDSNRSLSLYTRILYDAITDRFLIKQGKKSLEDIKIYVDRLVNIANKSIANNQHNAFRSSIVGTVYFNVGTYKPYECEQIYKEDDSYIIYSVEPMHANVKRISLKVILRFPCTAEEVAEIASKINKEAIYYEVYKNEKSKQRFQGLPNNIIFAYYGYDENDLVNNTYAYRTYWVDGKQDKKYWYKKTDSSIVVNDIWVDSYSQYDYIKKFISDNTVSDEQLVDKTRVCMYQMITAAEKFIGFYREYINRTVSETDFIKSVKELSVEIRSLYFEQTNLPIASKELHDWSEAYTSLAGIIDDFVIIYDDKSLTSRSADNRVQLMNIKIKDYNECLEKIKGLDEKMALKIKN